MLRAGAANLGILFRAQVLLGVVSTSLSDPTDLSSGKKLQTGMHGWHGPLFVPLLPSSGNIHPTVCTDHSLPCTLAVGSTVWYVCLRIRMNSAAYMATVPPSRCRPQLLLYLLCTPFSRPRYPLCSWTLSFLFAHPWPCSWPWH